MPKKLFHFVYALHYITQAAFALVFPAGLIVLLGWLMTNRWGCGRWAVVTGVVLGALCGVYSMFRFILTAVKTFDPTQGDDSCDGKSESSAAEH